MGTRQVQGWEDSEIKSFRVNTSYVEKLRDVAIPERKSRLDPSKPFIVDLKQAKDQFGLREQHIPELIENIIPGTGKIIED